MKLLLIAVLCLSALVSDSQYWWGDFDHYSDYRCEEPECNN